MANGYLRIEGKFNIGDKLQGTCTNVTDYGIFIEVDNGIEGLAHRDMLTWSSKKNSQPGNLYARSQSVECIVLEVDYVKKRLSLGVKQLTANPFEKYNELNPIGTIVDTEIKAIKDNIIFCSLEEDIDGAIFSQNISWDSHEDSKDQMQKFNVGDKIKAKIIENKNDKIALSIREVDGNPFDEIKDKSVGDTVTCTVSEVTDYGVKVMVGVNGPKVVIKKNDGKRISGILIDLLSNDDVILDVKKKIKNTKNYSLQEVVVSLNEIKETKLKINFK